MKLQVVLPWKILVDEEARKIVAEAEDGSFCLLPRHIDCTALLVPGILAYVNAAGKEIFLAVDEGLLVKCGDEVLVSVRNAATGPDLGTLRQAVEEQFRLLSESDRKARSALGRLEAGLLRQVLDWQEGSHA